MSCPRLGPCDLYASALDLCCLDDAGAFPDPCLIGGVPVPAAKVLVGLTAASEIMWALTGRQYGTCTVKVRPCSERCDPCGAPSFADWQGGFSSSWGGPYPALINGLWYNISCPCECCRVHCQVLLPSPICSIEEVAVDGMLLNPDQYRVDEFRHLVRIAGAVDIAAGDTTPCWPKCQDMNLADTEPNTFSVTLTYGKSVPEMLRLATAELACEIVRSCIGQACNLPKRLASVTRQGVTVSFLDPMEFLNKGKTGIYFVDLVIRALNPYGAAKRPGIWSPDAGPNWLVTDTGEPSGTS